MNKASLLFTMAACLVLLVSIPLVGYDNPHFYHATTFMHETRLGNDWFSTVDIGIGAGSSSTGRNSLRTSVPLLDIYGTHNMQFLGTGVMKDATNPLDTILINLELLPVQQDFGRLSYAAEFHNTEGFLLFTQNLLHGFFTQLHIPFRKLRISTPLQTDLSPEDSVLPNKNNPQWQAFLQNFDAIMQRYGLDTKGYSKQGVGDISLCSGWAFNYNETDWLDFVDVTTRWGIVLPTGEKRNENNVFDLPLGYNGHTGFSLSASLGFGFFEWLTLGTFVDALFFNSKAKNIRIKTALEQSGLIKLAKASAYVKPGTVWDVGVYAKADHFCRGLSFLVGYSLAQQNQTIISLCRQFDCFDPSVANSDDALHIWQQHTLHLMTEWDFTRDNCRWGSKVNVGYQRCLGGKRIFKTSLAGASLGVEFAFSY